MAGFTQNETWDEFKQISVAKKHHTMRDIQSYIELRNTFLLVDPEDT
jgi:hypothetical protein